MYLDLAREPKKDYLSWKRHLYLFYLARLVQSLDDCLGTGRLGSKKKSGDHQNDSIIEIGQNT